MRRCREGICGDIVVGMPEGVRDEEDEDGDDGEEQRQSECILEGIIRMEWDFISWSVCLYSEGVVGSEAVEGYHVQCDEGEDDEWQEVVESEEAVEGWVSDGESSPEPLDEGLAHPWDGGEEVCDDGCCPEAHLSPREDVSHEGGCHHCDEDGNADDPEEFPRFFVGSVIHSSKDVDIYDGEEEGCGIHVCVSDEPSVVYVAHDSLYGVESVVDVWGILHCEDDSGDHHDDEGDAGQGTEVPPIVEVSGGRIVDEVLAQETEDGQPMLDPSKEGVLEGGFGRFVMFGHIFPSICSSDFDTVFVEEGVWRQVEVFRSGSFSDSSCGIVLRAVARTEPSSIISARVCRFLSQRDASEVGADTDDDQPFWFLCSFLVGLGVSEFFDGHCSGSSDLFWCSAVDEDWFASPYDGDALSDAEG